jgi:hypothetical protein
MGAVSESGHVNGGGSAPSRTRRVSRHATMRTESPGGRRISGGMALLVTGFGSATKESVSRCRPLIHRKRIATRQAAARLPANASHRRLPENGNRRRLFEAPVPVSRNAPEEGVSARRWPMRRGNPGDTLCGRRPDSSASSGSGGSLMISAPRLTARVAWRERNDIATQRCWTRSAKPPRSGGMTNLPRFSSRLPRAGYRAGSRARC